jgi:hypothetical protein
MAIHRYNPCAAIVQVGGLASRGGGQVENQIA